MERRSVESVAASSTLQASDALRSANSSTLNAPDTQSSTIVKYICPMPEHVSIEYDHPGKMPDLRNDVGASISGGT